MSANKKHCSCCTQTVCIGVTLAVGVILAVLGAVSILLFDDLYKCKVKENLVMKKDTEAYNNWNKAPIPINMQYFIFNYTNVNDVVTNGSIPNVTQLGPYSYRETRVNYVIDYNEDNITYMQNYTYVFDPETSCATCKEDDVISTPYVAALTILHLLDGLGITNTSSAVKQIAVSTFAEAMKAFKATVFRKLTVKQLLWGYTDTFLALLKKSEKQLAPILKVLGLKFPDVNPFIAVQHNGSSEAMYYGNVSLRTGKKNIDDVQSIFKWHGLTDVPHWKTKAGRMINGTDGTHFKPFIEKDDKLYVFITDICRSVPLIYDSEQILMDVNLYRYRLPSTVFANATVFPFNKAFCVEKCWMSGLLPVKLCFEGNPPIFISNPHFYEADQRLVDGITGMHPTESVHSTYLDIEPTTGQSMTVHKRVQLNVLAQRVPLVPFTSKLHSENMFLPIMYVDEFANIDKKNMDKFKSKVFTPKKIMKGVEYGLMTLGGVIVIVALIIGVAETKKKKYSKLQTN